MNWVSILNMQNIIFFVIMFAILVYFIWNHKSHNSKLKIGSQMLIGLGVLGTFIGIFIALMNFNANDIQGSITTLLDGLKTAFVTSILGMLLSMFLNLIAYLNDYKRVDVGTNPLESMLLKLDEIAKTNVLIHKALVGDGDSSLATQLQKLRTEIRDGFTGMQKSFDEFAIKMAENNYNALIVALKEVITDFNALLSDLVAENFKQLNQGIEKLLQWQDNYAMQIDDQTRQLETATDTMDSIFSKFSDMSDRFEIFVKNSMKFDETAQNTEKLLNHTNVVLVGLANKMREFTQIGISANNAFDLIDKKINSMVDTMANSIQIQTNKANEIGNTYKSNMESLMRQNQETTSGYLKKNSEAFSKSLQEYDLELQNQLKNIINTFGTNLVSITNHFVNDFSKMSTNLNSVINRIEGTRNGTFRN